MGGLGLLLGFRGGAVGVKFKEAPEPRRPDSSGFGCLEQVRVCSFVSITSWVGIRNMCRTRTTTRVIVRYGGEAKVSG